MPAGPMASGAGPGAKSGAGPGAPAGQKPPEKQPSARPAAATRSAAGQPARQEPIDRTPSVDAVAMAVIPVSPARAERDAMAESANAMRRQGGKTDPLQLARRIAAALNAPGNEGLDDFGFFWVTAVTTEGTIVVANSYGLAYIPYGVQLPDNVHMASADEDIPANERARWATYPVMAVQGWAAHHDTKLRAVIGTEEQLANSDAGAAKVVLTPEDIPDSGDMVGRSRLEVVAPAAAERLAATADSHLIELLPPATADAKPRDDTQPVPEAMDPEAAATLITSLAAGNLDPQELVAQMPASVNPALADGRPILWLDVMKPMTSRATGREVAHLRAFHTYAAAAHKAILNEAHTAADLGAQRAAVADWLYWQHLSGLLDAALTKAS